MGGLLPAYLTNTILDLVNSESIPVLAIDLIVPRMDVTEPNLRGLTMSLLPSQYRD